ncbi:MAG: hypothetical protein ABR514_10005 [Chthoniobacterales bacterium]
MKKRRMFAQALTLAVAVGALSLAGCSTVESRISDHPEIYQGLSPTDQQLVSQGQVRVGMPMQAAWLAWGSPEQKAVGNMRGRDTETWIYITYRSAPYAYPYGPYGRFYGGVGFGFVSAHRIHHHHNRAFVFFGDPFFDPFFYSYIPPSVPVPYKTVTFANGRVVSFQYLRGYP